MKNKSFLFGTAFSAFLLFSLISGTLQLSSLDEMLLYSVRQYTKLSISLDDQQGFISTGNPLSPEWNYSGLGAWTVGFYGGSLWMLYKMTHDPYWASLALEYQERVKPRQFDTGTHDVGFVIMSTFGLALEYGDDNTENTTSYYHQIINETAISLSSRFHPPSGCLRSWNSDNGEVTVIIDNMMNLELLFVAFQITGNSTFRDIALSHADRTIQEHFRPDGGCFHVVGYNESTGSPSRKYNAQGYADNSTWSRGLAWAIHGYHTTYDFTRVPAYLETAEKAAAYFIRGLPSDSVPYWDFNAPQDTGEYQPRDTAAGAIAAHAFLKLYFTTEKTQYLEVATDIITGLEKYRADANPDYKIPAILVNGTVFYYQNDFNTAITYADFYYLRSIDLYKSIMDNTAFQN